MKNHKLIIATSLWLFFVWGCSDEFPDESMPLVEEEVLVTEETPFDLNEIEAIIAMASEPDGDMSNLRRHRSVVVVPEGSVNALEDAILSAGKGGAVVLKSGLHTETSTIKIPFGVKIIGEPGATLEVDSDPDGTNVRPLEIIPALYICNADRTLIWGVELQPPGDKTGGTGILIQNSKKVVVAENVINNHQISILLEGGDYACIWDNTINASTDWQTGALPFTQGIVVVNADQTNIIKNRISNGFLGIWACDKDSKFLHNTLQSNFIGLLLCTVPENNYLLPDGAIVGSEFSGTNWLVANNESNGNVFGGYVVIDGANHNTLVNNAASDNGRYDIELVGDSNRFGFFTPSSFDNTVVVGKYQTIHIKDCGLNNKVQGGILIDNATDPCF